MSVPLNPNRRGREKRIRIPYNFIPRDYQLPVFRTVPYKKKRGVTVWHRRAGKEKSELNLVINQMTERVGTYYYFFPTFAQGRKVLWDGIDRDGFRYMDHFPKELVLKKNHAEMKIVIKDKDGNEGSVFQIVGTDNFDYIMGTNPIGCVFSEYSLQNPAAWEYIRPILAENGGWAIFNLTPRGENHAYDLYEMARTNPDWFCELLTVDDTKRPDGSPVISEQMIQEERDSGMSEDMIDQEYYCSFSASKQGSYYVRQFRKIAKEGRIREIDWDPELLVDTYWDLGVGDSNAIWFVQSVGNEHRLIDYYEHSNVGLDHYVKYLEGLPYHYGRHVAPHDIKVREWSTGGIARIEKARQLGINFEIAPDISLEDGIEAVRALLDKCWFDDRKLPKDPEMGLVGAGYGVYALKSYHKEYDQKRKMFKTTPYHDWSSNGSDAFRYFAVSNFKKKATKREQRIYM